MVNGDELLTPLKIRGFNPLTARKNKRQRKIDLKNIIINKLKEQNLKLEKIKKLCNKKPLGIKARFYLLETGAAGSSEKDLDNLLKILFDVLSYDMIKNNTEEKLRGLNLMKDDERVYEIRASKKIVKELRDAGLDLSIYESSVQ